MSPLDWGLGHATRCVPIIEGLIARNIEVILAANGSAQDYLVSRFPELKILKPPAYDITYSGGRAFFDILLQTPKILKNIDEENRWLGNKINELNIDAVISDNRYGMSGDIPSVIITHQTSPRGPALLQGKLRRMVSKHLANFDHCWIPDDPDQSLSGELSNTEDLTIPYSHIGPISRLNPIKITQLGTILGLVSGPETQRTDFENNLREFLTSTGQESVLICGKPKSVATSVDGLITTHSHLDDESLAKAMLEAEYIFCRSGYSTILDLAKLGLKANLIPTRGQPEQVYLAEHLTENSNWRTFKEISHIKLKDCIPSRRTQLNACQNDSLEQEIDVFVKNIRSS